MRLVIAAGAACILGVVALGGCSRNEATEAARDHSTDAVSTSGSDGGGYVARADYRSERRTYGSRRRGYGDRGYGDQGSQDRPREATPLYHGEPLWSDNRSHSAQENAEYHFERSGASLGAKTVTEYVAIAHRFADHPPRGAFKLTRANGDRLLYDAKSNVFAVVRKDGAPRTLFKPDDGMAYWRQVKDREASGGEGRYDGGRRSHRRSRYSDRSDGADEG